MAQRTSFARSGYSRSLQAEVAVLTDWSLVKKLPILVVLLLVAGMREAVAADRIHDCASFTTWFQKQPGYQLTLAAERRIDEGAPKPRGGSDRLDVRDDDMTYYRGNVGGGGCIGAFYDGKHRLAEYISRYDTASDVGETAVTESPLGINAGVVSMPTHNGVSLGMTLRDVERIEGKGRHVKRGADAIVIYAWQIPSQGTTVYYWMGFVLRNNHVIAMDYFHGV